ncbi:MAG: YbaB/EbfC family nucleoid-associated protein [Tenericutes bacterium]|nr:YbaB/EbfC family nucleoid-associated protein [Mycoplasmatota bacterium]
MNMQNLMAQAKKLQNEMEKITKEIEETIFTYENSNILIEATGKNKIKKIQIINENILEDKEILEDILLVGINDVLDQIKNKKDEKLGKYTNGLGGLF